MTPGRRVLLIVFLIFFAIGVLPLLAGNIAETFIYWFVLAVMCGGIAVLIGGPQNSFHPPTATATTPPVLTATTPPVLMSPNPLTPQSGAHPVKSSFFKLWAKCAGVILLVGCVLGAFAGGAEGFYYSLGAGTILAPIKGLIWAGIIRWYRGS